MIDNNVNLDYNSDSDEYIDISSKIQDNTEHIFQFQLDNEKLFLKYIGKSSTIPDIIIKENFGQESNMSLYNCIYSYNELESRKNKNDDINNSDLELFFPIIRLVIIENDNKINNIVSSIAVKINQKIVYDEEINIWELYWIEYIKTNNYIRTEKIKKDINSLNILEKLIELYIINKI